MVAIGMTVEESGNGGLHFVRQRVLEGNAP